MTNKCSVPTHLTHKPIVACNYFGKENVSDVQYLSVGRGQYNPDSLAVKVFRRTYETEKWSRGEDVPAERLINMTILLLGALPNHLKNNINGSSTSLEEQWIDDSIGARQVIADWICSQKDFVFTSVDEI